MNEKKPPTHGAFTLRRDSRTSGRWLEIGQARIEHDGMNCHHIYLDRLPIGGFTGHIFLQPIGQKPPDPGAASVLAEDDENH
jgi:hypothetical protein